jgi:excisionase family DNA binding protein
MAAGNPSRTKTAGDLRVDGGGAPMDDGSAERLRDQLLTVGQAGEYLGTGERFVRRLVAQRRIAYVKLGKYVRLQRSALDAFIEAGRIPSE